MEWFFDRVVDGRHLWINLLSSGVIQGACFIAIAFFIGRCVQAAWKARKIVKRRRVLDRLKIRLEIHIALGTLIGFLLIFVQLAENYKANLASTRDQLYAKEAEITTSEFGNSHLSLIYVHVPNDLSGRDFYLAHVGLLGPNPDIEKAASASELYLALFGYEAFRKMEHLKKETDKDPFPTPTATLFRSRALYLHAQEMLYHVHNAHDYWKDGILSDKEWETWNGMIREVGANPMFMAAIWQGHRYRYFSRDFGKFLQKQLYDLEYVSDSIRNSPDEARFQRDRAFIETFYPEMTKKEWAASLPHY